VRRPGFGGTFITQGRSARTLAGAGGIMNRHLQPCAVVMRLRDGTQTEQVFATRFQAEIFLYLLPMLMMTLPDGDQIAGAILSPLVEENLSFNKQTVPGKFPNYYLQ
jgi:hypothetical protein